MTHQCIGKKTGEKCAKQGRTRSWVHGQDHTPSHRKSKRLRTPSPYGFSEPPSATCHGFSLPRCLLSSPSTFLKLLMSSSADPISSTPPSLPPLYQSPPISPRPSTTTVPPSLSSTQLPTRLTPPPGASMSSSLLELARPAIGNLLGNNVEGALFQHH